MVNNSISGTSLAFVVLMFLASFGACTKLTKCARISDKAGDVAKNGKKLEKIEDLQRYNQNMEILIGLYKNYKEVKIGNGLKLVLPDIAQTLDNTRSYDHIFEIHDAANHFFIQTKNQAKTENGIVEEWLTFRREMSIAHAILRIPTLLDSLDLPADKNGYSTKAYKYPLYNDTICGLVKFIETKEGFTFIEAETPSTYENFYEISDMLLQAAIVPESKIITSNATNKTNKNSY